MTSWMCRAACSAAGVVVSAGAALGAPSLGEWNLASRGSVWNTSEVSGSALIGGSLWNTSNYSIAQVTAGGGEGLAVLGDVHSIVNVNNGGHLRIGGVTHDIVNYNGGGSRFDDPQGVQAYLDAVFPAAQGISTYLASLQSNGQLDQAGNMNATPDLIDGQLVAVYNIHQNDLNGLGQLNLSFGGAESVIINILSDNGEVSLVAPPNLVGDFTLNNAANILWNLPDADTVVVNNNFNGALLAPYADLRLLGGGINGTVVVDSVSQMDAEIRLPMYVGFVPTPGAGGLFMLGLAAIARRRR